MAKRIHHMGMTLSKRSHDELHKSAPELNSKQHEALMKRMGITKEQDEEWHRTHLTLGEQRAVGLKQIDPAAVSAGFVEWCVKQKWFVKRGEQCFASKEGLRELRNRFEIEV